MSESRRPPLLPPIWALLTIGMQYALLRLLPGPQLVVPPWTNVGLGLFVLGFLLILYCGGLFRRHGTSVRPGDISDALIIHGPYRWSRNPIYMAMGVMLVGSAVWFGTATAFLPLVGFFWIISSQFIAMEEQMLIDRFGDEYHDYRGKVRRWL